MSVQIQIVRRGEETWELTRIDFLWKEADGLKAHEYETVARVIRDGAFYYVEFPEWKAEAFTWKREPRGYLIPRAAFKVAAKGKQTPVVS